MKEFENGFYVSFLNRLIQDLLDHGASKESKNLLWKLILRFLRRPPLAHSRKLAEHDNHFTRAVSRRYRDRGQR